MVSPLIDACLGIVPTYNGQQLLYTCSPMTKYPSILMAFIFLLMNENMIHCFNICIPFSEQTIFMIKKFTYFDLTLQT